MQRDTDYDPTNAYTTGKHLDNIMSLQNTLRKIGRDKSFSENQLSKSMIERLEAISNAEYVIYTYYPILACAVVNGRITARQFGSIIYDSGYQYEKLKGGNYLDGTNANAFVHAMWNAYIYTSLIKQHKYDSTTAEQLTWLASAMHEYSDAGAKKNLGWLSNVNMDLYNNSKGIEIAKQLIDNKYLTGILGQHDNWESREVDIAINIVNAVSEGRLLRNKKIDYATSNKKVVLINAISSAPYKTDGTEMASALINSDKIKNALLMFFRGRDA